MWINRGAWSPITIELVREVCIDHNGKIIDGTQRGFYRSTTRRR
jgi:hypothetical protein